MTQETRPGHILCPVCSAKTPDRTCPGCGEDLSLLQEYQDLAVASYNLGLHLAQHHRQNSIEHAKECLRLATVLKANFVEPHVVLGKLYAQQRQYSKAIAHWSQALRIDPKHKETRYCFSALRKLLRGSEELRLEADWQGKLVRIGSLVRCTDGHIGMVWRVVPSNNDDQLTHIVVSIDDFFPRNLLVPANSITDVSGDTVFIGASLRELLRRMPQYRGDEELASRVSDILLTYEPIRAIQGMAITLAVADGMVVLSGNVPSGTIKKKAQELAMSVRGVLAVANSLTCDTELELAVAYTLASSPQIKGEGVIVRSYLGTVLLEGRVSSTQAGETIGQLVRQTSGVKQVINRLTINPIEEGSQKKG